MLRQLNPRFRRIWIGQTLSEIGSSLTAMAAAVHVFIESGSASGLGLLMAAGTFPYVLAGLAGAWIDRQSRRLVMFRGDLVAALGPAGALTISLFGELATWHLVVAAFVSGLGTAVQVAASQAAVPALVEPDQLDQANALKQMGPALGIVIGPLVATPILVAAGIEAILVIDLMTFALAFGALWLTPFDDPPASATVDDDGSHRMALLWLRGEGGPLLWLMGLTGAMNLVFAWFNVAILATATAAVGAAGTGPVLAVGGIAMVVGSGATATFAQGRNRLTTVVVSLAAGALGAAVAAAHPSPWPIIAGLIIALGVAPAASAAISATYNEHVPSPMQGRVFALRGAIGQALNPIGSVTAGVAISGILAPSMESGVLRDSVGRIIGAGADRGPAAALAVTSLSLIGLGLLTLRMRDRLPRSGGEALRGGIDVAVGVVTAEVAS